MNNQSNLNRKMGRYVVPFPSICQSRTYTKLAALSLVHDQQMKKRGTVKRKEQWDQGGREQGKIRYEGEGWRGIGDRKHKRHNNINRNNLIFFSPLRHLSSLPAHISKHNSPDLFFHLINQSLPGLPDSKRRDERKEREEQDGEK